MSDKEYSAAEKYLEDREMTFHRTFPYIPIAMTDFATQQAMEFAEWMGNKYQRFFDHWILRNNPNGGLIIEDPYTTEQPHFTTADLWKMFNERNKK